MREMHHWPLQPCHQTLYRPQTGFLNYHRTVKNRCKQVLQH